MHYDPIKKTLGNFFNRSPFLRKLFYRLLDLLLLRAWHIQHELKKILSALRGKELAILDAGSGFGQYTWYMHRLAPKASILAVDVKEEQVADCNNFFGKMGAINVSFRVDNLVTFRKEKEFDLILCVDVMEHIEEDIAVFKNYFASLKPGGVLLISTPSDQGGSDAHDESDTSFIEEHVRNGYNAKEIEEKIRSAGFSKAEVRYSYGTPGKISWRLSMKYPILLLGSSKIFLLILPFYYTVVYPFCFILNYLDLHARHISGTGLIVKAVA
jgi:2-polyprenyl-3-methyl-5-hydroxy-6-metoxy-1,4-benzoquinol methylase